MKCGNDGAGKRFEQVRELAKDLDLTTPEGERQARQLLEEYDLPQYMIYVIQDTPITPEAAHWAEQRIAELRASGDVSGDPERQL